MSATDVFPSDKKIHTEELLSLLPADWIPMVLSTLADIQNNRISSRKSRKMKAGCPYKARDLSKPNTPFGLN